MYILSRCSHCRQPIQVPESSVGKLVECPLCDRPTIAEPSQVAAPVARELSESQEVLSLDDASPLPPKKNSVVDELNERRRRMSVATTVAMSLAFTLLVMAMIVTGYGLWHRQSQWERFASQDGNFSILLPGRPQEEDILAVGFANLGGKRFVVKWKTPAKISGETAGNFEVSVGWIDLDSQKLVGTQFDQLAIPVREREAQRIEGKAKLASRVSLIAHQKKFESAEYILETAGGIAILRLYIQEGDPRKRMYILLVRGPDLDPTDDWIARFFNSFEPVPM